MEEPNLNVPAPRTLEASLMISVSHTLDDLSLGKLQALGTFTTELSMIVRWAKVTSNMLEESYFT